VTAVLPEAESPPAALQFVLEAEHLARRFGDRVAVADLSVQIAPGGIYGLLGPNGAGKTTAIRMMCGLLRRDGGSVLVGGEPVSARSTTAKHWIGFVPQDVALYPDLSAAENLRFFGRLYGLRGDLLDQRVMDVLELIDLADRGRDRVESFSGGMKRRLNIGAALLHRPRLLVLDEPTVGVDPQSRHSLLDSVGRFRAEGMAVLYTTHYMEEAERVCDRVGIIDHGRLIAEGTRRELVAQVAGQDRIDLVASGDLAALAAGCRSIDGITGSSIGEGEVHLLARDGHQLVPRVFEAAERVKVAVKSVEIVEPDLEAVFLHLTGTALRE